MQIRQQAPDTHLFVVLGILVIIIIIMLFVFNIFSIAFCIYKGAPPSPLYRPVSTLIVGGRAGELSDRTLLGTGCPQLGRVHCFHESASACLNFGTFPCPVVALLPVSSLTSLFMHF